MKKDPTKTRKKSSFLVVNFWDPKNIHSKKSGHGQTAQSPKERDPSCCWHAAVGIFVSECDGVISSLIRLLMEMAFKGISTSKKTC